VADLLFQVQLSKRHAVSKTLGLTQQIVFAKPLDLYRKYNVSPPDS
jgi:hypothetical protein